MTYLYKTESYLKSLLLELSMLNLFPNFFYKCMQGKVVLRLRPDLKQARQSFLQSAQAVKGRCLILKQPILLSFELTVFGSSAIIKICV